MSPSEPTLLTTTLIKAARALLGWDQHELARKSGLSRKTISLIEAADSLPTDPRRVAALVQVRQALEASGVQFEFKTRRGGEGVRLKR